MTTSRPALRRLGSLLVLVLGTTVLLGLSAPQALAHAALLRTAPGDAEILASAPSEVTLTFGERVGIGLGNLRVLDSDGERMDDGAPSLSDGGTVVRIPVRPGLHEGSYVVAWRVVSADSHPVSGAFTFSVGKPDVPPEELRGRGNLTSINAAPRAPGIALGIARFLGFSALVVLLGGAVFCLVLWPAGLPGLKRLLLGAALVEAITAGAGLLLQGPYAAGEGISRLADSSLLGAVMDTRYGEATALRGGCASAVLLAVLVLGGRPRRWAAGVVAALGMLIALCWAAAGHAGVGRWQPWTYALDAAHLLFVSAWVGGLVVLVRGVRGRWSPADQAALLPGWSRLAAWSVALLVATGLFASFREVGELAALLSTRYGALLVVKSGLVGLMLLLALVGRSFVRQHYTQRVAAAATGTSVDVRLEPTEEDVAGLRRSVSIEAVLAVVVLAVTALLVSTPPARDAFAPPYSGRSTAGPTTVQVDVYPARKGLNGLHVYTVGEGGLTVDVAEVTGYLQRGDEKLTVEPTRKSRGHYEDLSVVIPGKGTWSIHLEIRTSDIDSYETVQQVTVK